MIDLRRIGAALASALVASLVPVAASADTITANCTGMLDLEKYEFDPDQPTQEVAQLGTAEFSIDEEAIVLTGAFGEYRFDLNAGTLYHNGSDTGLYCTYTGLDD